MVSQFHFKNFEADEELKVAANLSLNRILELAPCDSTAIAILEKEEGGFRCKLDVYTRLGPVITNAFGRTAFDTLRTVEEKLKNQILVRRSRWSERQPAKSQTFQAAS